MQSRTARWIIVVTLIALAGVLHFGQCQWLFHGNAWGLEPLLGLGYMHNGPSDASGVYPRTGVNGSTALNAGVVLPLGMLAVCAALIVNWRFVDRKRAGQCLKCGYPLKGLAPSACPECGTTK